MKLSSGLIACAVGMVGAAAASGQPELVVPAMLFAAAAAASKRRAKQQEDARTLAELEKRLSLTEGELESAASELETLRVEREFDRQLLHAPKPKE